MGPKKWASIGKTNLLNQLNFEKPCRFVLEQFYPEDPDLGCIQALGSVLENINIPCCKFTTTLLSIMANAISNESEHLRMIKPLLPLMKEDQRGRALFHAASKGHTKVVKILTPLTGNCVLQIKMEPHQYTWHHKRGIQKLSKSWLL